MKSRFLRKTVGTAAGLLIAAAGAAHAQGALIPPALTAPHHSPAAVPTAARTLPVAPRLPNGTFIAGSVHGAGGGGIWKRPQAHVDSLAAFGLPTFNNVGPSTILNAGGGVGVALQPVAGRIVAIATHPTNANIIYVAAAGGGVWKTTDGGSTWIPLTDNLPDIAMGSLALDPQSPNVIYAGSGEANFSGDSRYGQGLYKSVDGGANWTVYTGPSNVFALRAISKIVVDPTNSSVVYLTLARAANGSGGGYGVYKSTDGGATWAQVFNPGQSCTDLAIDPTNTQTLYTAVGEIFGRASNGIYKSTNGGSNWTPLSGFPTGSTVGRIALALAPSNPQVLYADYTTTDNNTFGALGGFYSTTNGGTTWTKAPTSTDGVGQHRCPKLPGRAGLV